MRGEIPLVVLDALGPGGSTRFAVGASVTINVRGGGQAPVYSAQSAGAVLPQPLTTDASGRVEGWVDRGSYDAVIASPTTGTLVVPFEIVPAGAGAADTSWIADRAVTLPKLDATGATAGYVLTVQADGSVVAAAPPAVAAGGPTVMMYKTRTTAVNPISATTSSAPTDIVVGDPVVLDGATWIKVEMWAPQLVLGAANLAVNIGLYAGTTLVTTAGPWQTPATSFTFGGIYAMRRIMPAAGTYTYKWAAWASAATGGQMAGVDANTPIAMRITRDPVG